MCIRDSAVSSHGVKNSSHRFTSRWLSLSTDYADCLSHLCNLWIENLSLYLPWSFPRSIARLGRRWKRSVRELRVLLRFVLVLDLCGATCRTCLPRLQ